MRRPTRGKGLQLMILGSPCTDPWLAKALGFATQDWSSWGGKLGMEGATMSVFLTAPPGSSYAISPNINQHFQFGFLFPFRTLFI